MFILWIVIGWRLGGGISISLRWWRPSGILVTGDTFRPKRSPSPIPSPPRRRRLKLSMRSWANLMNEALHTNGNHAEEMMQLRPLGKTGLTLSVISFVASSLGQKVQKVDLPEAIRTVHV